MGPKILIPTLIPKCCPPTTLKNSTIFRFPTRTKLVENNKFDFKNSFRTFMRLSQSLYNSNFDSEQFTVSQKKKATFN